MTIVQNQIKPNVGNKMLKSSSADIILTTSFVKNSSGGTGITSPSNSKSTSPISSPILKHSTSGNNISAGNNTTFLNNNNIFRKTIAWIDREAISSNVRNQLSRMNGTTKLFAVVKANGYGHGAIEVAKAAKRGGATGFCVAIIEEALELRNHDSFKDDPLLVMGLSHPNEAPIMAKKKISITVTNLEWLQDALLFMSQQQKNSQNGASTQPLLPLNVHVAVDTGMGRIGLTSVEDLAKIQSFFNQHSAYFKFEGIFTHFATADSTDSTLYAIQFEKFHRMLSSLAKKPTYVHISNSASALYHNPPIWCNMIRFGIAMYGLNPGGKSIPSPFPLKQALSLVTELVHVKRVKEGDTIGYGATYKAKEGDWIGTLPIGYADGWRRDLQGQTVLIQGERCEIIGRVCMDQCMIRMPREYPVGTQVVLVGKSEKDEITLQELSDKLNTIHYELACCFTNRVPRLYFN
ncbi:hypothetical protein CYY_002560 [Polysphondylium violaceum]|uniref:Alanine racemase C-terminal domain-containing protein n=1 Tax=Polysphondylium violaceum TaxID=133409 RepID=A0A8J4V2C7_9MYCE|nr:hypothetical protein CYY_002560 [Polysphondylium violaceum]